jgi:hypothetical protein
MPENEAVIFEATPRAPFAAVAIAAAAASWIEAAGASPALGTAAMSEGIGWVPEGAAEDEAAAGEAGDEAAGAGDGAAGDEAAGDGAAEAAGEAGDEAAEAEARDEAAGAGDGAAGDEAAGAAGASAAGETLPRWEPFWLGFTECPADPLGAPASASFDAVSSTAGPSAAAGSSAAPRSAVIPGEPSPAARDDSTRLSTRPPQHGSLTRGYLPSQLLLIRPNQQP